MKFSSLMEIFQGIFLKEGLPELAPQMAIFGRWSIGCGGLLTNMAQLFGLPKWGKTKSGVNYNFTKQANRFTATSPIFWKPLKWESWCGYLGFQIRYHRDWSKINPPYIATQVTKKGILTNRKCCPPRVQHIEIWVSLMGTWWFLR